MATYLSVAGHQLDLDTLLFVEAEGSQLHFYTPEARFSAQMTLADALSQLPDERFMRVHKRYVINLAHIHKVEPLQVLVGDQIPVPLSPAYRDALRAVGRKREQGA
jgi:DNA-binding LytR/AlgR family response regulator